MIRTRVTRISQVITVVVGVALASLAWTASASAASAPSVESESVSNITATDATMEARVDPGSLETEYQFRVIGAPCRAEPVNCLIPPGSGPDYPSPPARIAAASGGQVVKLDLTSAGLTLTPGKEYHYAVFATNPQGTASQPEQSFTTPPTNAPLIEGESVSHITATDATLEAQINPNGLETTYRFELESGCGIEKPEPGHATCMVIVGTSVPPGQIPPSSEGETVRVNLEAAGVTLRPDTEYRYRVAATNSAGSTKQEEAQVFKQTFTTSSSAPVIESESVSSITPTDATLEAKINTEGLETTYEFNLSERWRCEEVEPRCLRPGLQTFFGLPADKLLGSFVGQTVSLDLNSAGVILSPGHNFYEYSIRATSAAGTTGGEPKRFTTPSEAGTEPLTEPSGSTDPQSSATIQSLPSGPRRDWSALRPSPAYLTVVGHKAAVRQRAPRFSWNERPGFTRWANRTRRNRRGPNAFTAVWSPPAIRSSLARYRRLPAGEPPGCIAPLPLMRPGRLVRCHSRLDVTRTGSRSPRATSTPASARAVLSVPAITPPAPEEA